MTRRKFNQEMYNYLVKNGKKHTIKEWFKILNKKYNEEFTLIDLQKYFYRNKILYKYENEKKTHVNGNSLPIGAEYIKPDGMTLVKTKPNKWEYKQRLIYEKYYNVELNTDDMIVFLDGDRNNFDINNLMLVKTREYNNIRNKGLIVKDTEIMRTALLASRLEYKTKDYENEKC